MAIRLEEAIATRLEAIALRLEAIASGLEASPLRFRLLLATYANHVNVEPQWPSKICKQTNKRIASNRVDAPLGAMPSTSTCIWKEPEATGFTVAV